MNKLRYLLSLIVFFSLNLFSQNDEPIDLKDYYGDMAARQIGPAVMSGRISDMENHPTDPMIIYTGTCLLYTSDAADE